MYARTLAAHPLPLPQHILAILIRFVVDILIKLVADGRDVDFTEVAKFLDIELELKELAFSVLAEVEVEVEDALLA